MSWGLWEILWHPRQWLVSFVFRNELCVMGVNAQGGMPTVSFAARQKGAVSILKGKQNPKVGLLLNNLPASSENQGGVGASGLLLPGA